MHYWKIIEKKATKNTTQVDSLCGAKKKKRTLKQKIIWKAYAYKTVSVNCDASNLQQVTSSSVLNYFNIQKSVLIKSVLQAKWELQYSRTPEASNLFHTILVDLVIRSRFFFVRLNCWIVAVHLWPKPSLSHWKINECNTNGKFTV